jgi:hypothetical protein
MKIGVEVVERCGEWTFIAHRLQGGKPAEKLIESSRAWTNKRKAMSEGKWLVVNVWGVRAIPLPNKEL